MIVVRVLGPEAPRKAIEPACVMQCAIIVEICRSGRLILSDLRTI